MSGIIRRPLAVTREVLTEPTNRVHLSAYQCNRVDELLGNEFPSKRDKSELNFYFGIVMDACNE